MADKTTVTVETLRAHTHDGQAHEIGDRYEVDEASVGNLERLAMAKRVPPETPKAKK